jgi:DNA-binding protein YbaB
MSAEMHDIVEKAAKDLRRTQTRLKAIRKKLDGTVTKVSSRDRMVTVTINQSGGMESIEFNSQKFRRMAPAELGSVLVETIRQAQAQSRERLLRAYQPLLPDHLGARDFMAGKTDLDQVFEDAMRQADELMPGQMPIRTTVRGRPSANGRASSNGRASANGKDDHHA